MSTSEISSLKSFNKKSEETSWSRKRRSCSRDWSFWWWLQNGLYAKNKETVEEKITASNDASKSISPIKKTTAKETTEETTAKETTEETTATRN